MSLSLDDVTQRVRHHLHREERLRPERQRYRRAYERRMWEGENYWTFRAAKGHGSVLSVTGNGDADPLPVRMEVNRVRNFVKSSVGNLWYQSPQVRVTAPDVMDAVVGRPPSIPEWAADAVAKLGQSWLTRAHVRQQATYGYQIALMYHYAAAKLFVDRGKLEAGVPLLDCIEFVTVPPWAFVYDDNAPSPEKLTYYGHLRQEYVGDLERMFPDAADKIREAKRHALTDHLDNDGIALDVEERAEEYLHLLEFYDLSDRSKPMLRWFLCDVEHTTASLIEIDSDVWPYMAPGQEPVQMMHPIILDNVPEHPLKGVAAVDGEYGIQAEQSLLLSYAANAFRRDMQRKVIVPKGLLSEEARGELLDDRDWALVDVDVNAAQVPWGSGILQPVSAPQMPASLNHYSEMLRVGAQDQRGTSELVQGRQLKYASATEASLLADYSESSTGETVSRMDDVVSRCIRSMFCILAGELEDDNGRSKSVRVKVGRKWENVDAGLLHLGWTVSIVDNVNTPVKQQQRRQEWSLALPILERLALAAAGGAPVPGPDGQPGQPSVPPLLQRFAQEAFDYTVSLYQLPDTMTWDELEASAAENEPEPEGEPVMSDAEIEELVMSRMTPNGGPPNALAAPPLP